jgi:hypothetical protein
MSMDNAFEDLVRHFLAHCRDEGREDLRGFSRSGTVEGVIADAARSIRPDGSKHPHQWRVPRAVLDDACDHLLPLQGAIVAARDFDDLHQAVERAILPIHGVGDLLVYDVATRIGAFLGLKPDVVYLHRGTRDGARSLGHRGRTVAVSALPRAFHRLTAAEIEDCLCLYKGRIHEIVTDHHAGAHERSSAACGERATRRAGCAGGGSRMVVDRPACGNRAAPLSAPAG